MQKIKTCASCKVSKELSLFGKRNDQKDGYSYYCKSCKYETDKIYRLKNRESLLQKKKEYYLANRDVHLERMKQHYQENSVEYKTRSKKWKDNNRDLHNASCMERYTIKLNRCPAWAKELTDLVCEEAYRKAKVLENLAGVPHDVDHIVPLRGKTVSGLHIYNNLQVIPAFENRSKKHHYWPDQWERKP